MVRRVSKGVPRHPEEVCAPSRREMSDRLEVVRQDRAAIAACRAIREETIEPQELELAGVVAGATAPLESDEASEVPCKLAGELAAPFHERTAGQSIARSRSAPMSTLA